jgi:hypothetical protein
MIAHHCPPAPPPTAAPVCWPSLGAPICRPTGSAGRLWQQLRARGAGYVGEHSDYSFRAVRRRCRLRERSALRDRWCPGGRGERPWIRLLNVRLRVRRAPTAARRTSRLRTGCPYGPGACVQARYCSGSCSNSTPFILSWVLGSGPRPSAKASSWTRRPCSSPGRPKFPSTQRGSV